MSPTARRFALILPCMALAMLLGADAHAQAQPPPSSLVMENLLVAMQEGSKTWHGAVIDYARWFFWSMALISVVWTFGMMALRRADIGEFFFEFIRFCILLSVFWWLLDAGTGDAGLMMGFEQTIRVIAQAMNGNAPLAPDSLLLPGLKIIYEVISNAGELSQNHFSLASNLALVTVIALTLASVNIVLMTVALWILAYGGIFLLGFGAARWSSDVAINYYKHVVSVVFALLVMRLISAVASSFLDSQYQATVGATFNLSSQVLMMVIAIAVAVLMTCLPALLASVVLGSRFTHPGSAYGLTSQAASVGGSAIYTGSRAVASEAQAAVASLTSLAASARHEVDDNAMFDTSIREPDVIASGARWQVASRGGIGASDSDDDAADDADADAGDDAADAGKDGEPGDANEGPAAGGDTDTPTDQVPRAPSQESPQAAAIARMDTPRAASIADSDMDAASQRFGVNPDGASSVQTAIQSTSNDTSHATGTAAATAVQATAAPAATTTLGANAVPATAAAVAATSSTSTSSTDTTVASTSTSTSTSTNTSTNTSTSTSTGTAGTSMSDASSKAGSADRVEASGKADGRSDARRSVPAQEAVAPAQGAGLRESAAAGPQAMHAPAPNAAPERSRSVAGRAEDPNRRLVGEMLSEEDSARARDRQRTRQPQREKNKDDDDEIASFRDGLPPEQG